MAYEYDDEQLAALLTDIGSDVSKAKQSLEHNIKDIDDKVAYLHASYGDMPTSFGFPASFSDASTPALSESSQGYLCRKCGTEVQNVRFRVLGGLKGQCLLCFLRLDPDSEDANRDTPASFISELSNDDHHHESRDHTIGASMSDSAPRLVLPVNHCDFNGKPPAVLEQASEEEPFELKSIEEGSIEEEELLKEENEEEKQDEEEEESEESTYLSSIADENPLAEIQFGLPLQHKVDQSIDRDHVFNDEDHDGMQKSQDGNLRMFLASPPVWQWLETVDDESELLIIPNAARLDRIMETLSSDTSSSPRGIDISRINLSSDTSSPPRLTEPVASTEGQRRGSHHSYHFGYLTRSVISKGNDLTQSIITKGKKKAGRREKDRYEFGDFTRGLLGMGLNRAR